MDPAFILTHPSLEGLTPRQKRLVAFRIQFPLESNSSIIRRAGYREASVTGGGGKVIRSNKVQSAISAILTETISNYSQNPREWVKYSLMRHATGESGAQPSEQIRATELIGKMTGEFSSRIEIGTSEGVVQRLTGKVMDGLSIDAS